MVSCSCCFSRVLMLMSCERSSLSYQRSFLAVSICRCTEIVIRHAAEASSSMRRNTDTGKKLLLRAGPIQPQCFSSHPYKALRGRVGLCNRKVYSQAGGGSGYPGLRLWCSWGCCWCWADAGPARDLHLAFLPNFASTCTPGSCCTRSSCCTISASRAMPVQEVQAIM